MDNDIEKALFTATDWNTEDIIELKEEMVEVEQAKGLDSDEYKKLEAQVAKLEKYMDWLHSQSSTLNDVH